MYVLNKFASLVKSLFHCEQQVHALLCHFLNGFAASLNW